MQNQPLEMAQQLYACLLDIQPNISMSGLEEEAETIKKMKVDMALLVSELTPDHPALERVVKACRIDTISTYMAMREKLFLEDDEDSISDEHLQMASMAAELFIKRCQDYLDSKTSLKKHENGGIHGSER